MPAARPEEPGVALPARCSFQSMTDMTKRFRTVAWATGVVGTSALRRIIAHPQLDLVGVRVYSDEKKGRDAGDLVGLPLTGVIATQDTEEILALAPDCIVYSPMPWDVNEMCRILSA
ncbi:MAG: hypothetical protein EBU54_12875, partial [Mycobacteriaceae bacterium]|nr:hypothetical protein [Mycobacteriaceae bacterium]